jgi:hypothetical protein
METIICDHSSEKKPIYSKLRACFSPQNLKIFKMVVHLNELTNLNKCPNDNNRQVIWLFINRAHPNESLKKKENAFCFHSEEIFSVDISILHVPFHGTNEELRFIPTRKIFLRTFLATLVKVEAFFVCVAFHTFFVFCW